MIEISFDLGTLLIEGDSNEISLISKYVTFDKRVKKYRAEAQKYAFIVLSLYKNGIQYTDNAKKFGPISLKHDTPFQPRNHQKRAFDAWKNGGRRGVVIMPTGAGKSFLARMVIEDVSRPTLVIVPTIDLMVQWSSQLEEAFHQPIGMLGGGSRDIQNITVSTYDSAVINMEYIGDRFGLLVVDECHHLPGNVNRTLAINSIAPFRLGITATPEHEFEHILYETLGPKLFEIHIDELEGEVLAPYEIETILVELDEQEQIEYDKNREIYLNFVKTQRIDFRNRGAWGEFIVKAFSRKGGKEAFAAYKKQKQIAQTSRSKLNMVWEILNSHQGERILIFTADNDTAYTIGKRLYLPVITHNTKAKERKKMLELFKNGEYLVLVTSKVLNEGIDVPEASVGIILSGSGSPREHVQRLGRILRPSDDKKAILYEVISSGTSETSVSERRRQHRAYERFNQI